jgi:hypothetical protein
LLAVLMPLLLDVPASLEELEPPQPATSNAAAQAIAVCEKPNFISLPVYINKLS